jgi:hypothetical protein
MVRKSPGSIPVWVQVPPRLPTDYEVTMLVCHRCGSDKVTHAVALGSKNIHLGKFADFEYIKKHDGLVPECAQCQKDREYISRYMKYSENIIKDDIKEHKHYKMAVWRNWKAREIQNLMFIVNVWVRVPLPLPNKNK